MRFEILTEALLKIYFFWDVTLSRVVYTSEVSKRHTAVILTVKLPKKSIWTLDPEDERTTIFRNVRN